MKRKVCLLALFAAFCAMADEVPPPDAALAQVGDCVILREGGVGRILKTPTYWLRGTVAVVSRARHFAALCPQVNKPVSAYTREDWLRFAAAAPCVDNAADAREVSVLRLGVRVEAWETPWSNQHGTARFLFRGQFLDQPLKKGEVVEINAAWLERCENG
jgi:hypothetical protein